MDATVALADRAAASDINILILGETGAGKEVLARRIHDRSRNARGPLVSVNCAAICETLAESELFGHERGSFTGADKARVGLLESAHGGTLFLDEVGELSLSMQAKLLRVIETRSFVRLGGRTPVKVDVRFVAATNLPLESAVAAGKFRADLFFRLNQIKLFLPPLRARLAEIPALVDLFIEEFCVRNQRVKIQVSPAAMQCLLRHQWPGNVRELKNVIERALVIAESERVEAKDIVLDDALPLPTGPGLCPEYESSADEATWEDGCERVRAALAEHGGNQTRAAKTLGISRGTLINRIKKYGLTRPQTGSSGSPAGAGCETFAAHPGVLQAVGHAEARFRN